MTKPGEEVRGSHSWLRVRSLLGVASLPLAKRPVPVDRSRGRSAGEQLFGPQDEAKSAARVNWLPRTSVREGVDQATAFQCT